MWPTKCYTFTFFFFFSGKDESLVFCVGPCLYWCPYALTDLHSQGWSIRSLRLMSNDHQHHLWHGTMLAYPRMHHNITEERVRGPCNYLVKPGSYWLCKSVWKSSSLHARLEKQLLLAWNSTLSSQGLCLNTHAYNTRSFQPNQLLGKCKPELLPWQPCSGIAFLVSPLWALWGLSAELSRADLMPAPMGAQTPFAGYDWPMQQS